MKSLNFLKIVFLRVRFYEREKNIVKEYLNLLHKAALNRKEIISSKFKFLSFLEIVKTCLKIFKFSYDRSDPMRFSNPPRQSIGPYDQIPTSPTLLSVKNSSSCKIRFQVQNLQK